MQKHRTCERGNVKEPLGLPRGSVRALIAVILVGVTAYLFGIQAPVPTELLILDGVAMTHYFSERNAEAARDAELPEPYLGDVD